MTNIVDPAAERDEYRQLYKWLWARSSAKHSTSDPQTPFRTESVAVPRFENQQHILDEHFKYTWWDVSNPLLSSIFPVKKMVVREQYRVLTEVITKEIEGMHEAKKLRALGSTRRNSTKQKRVVGVCIAGQPKQGMRSICD